MSCPTANRPMKAAKVWEVVKASSRNTKPTRLANAHSRLALRSVEPGRACGGW